MKTKQILNLSVYGVLLGILIIPCTGKSFLISSANALNSIGSQASNN